MRLTVIALFGLLLATASIQASASAKKEAKPAEPNSIYVAMDPSLVVNFGSPGAKLRYLRADIVLRLLDPATEELVKLHMPQLRHNMLMLLSGQTDETVSSFEGKEKIRLQALEQVRSIIKAQPPVTHGEEKKSDEENKEAAELEKEKKETGGVTDLLFNNFVVQK